ncbi:MAG: DUF1360 domain-containing protein [Pseudolabrys sp.]
MKKEAEIREEQYFWSAVALVVFVALCAAAVALVARYGDFDPDALTFLDLTLMGFAAFRVVHLLTYDKIFDMVRAAFMDREGVRLKTAERGWRRLVCEFMQCIWCTGMWSGLIVATIYLLGIWGRFATIVLAVAGLGSLLQLASKALAARA